VVDLFQEAIFGVIEAIDTFNTELGTSFTTYAYFHIRKRIIDFIKKNKLVRAPRDIARNLKHVGDIRNKLFTTAGREPTPKEIVNTLRKDKGIVLKEEMVDSIIILIELNSAGNSQTFINEYTEQVVEEEEEQSDLFRILELNIESKLKSFPTKIQQMIKYRFGVGCDSPHTLEEAAYILGITKEDQNVIKLMPESDKHFFI
jgi:RNA polymerase sigma factor (sigma-70 family)